MADTAIKNEAQKQEFFDSQEVLDEKVTLVAELIRKSKYFTAMTGAGISTSCGIPDFRSGVNTVLPTGPGVWEKRAQGIKGNTKESALDSTKAIPSYTHMSLIALNRAGLLKFLISQNTDGLHLKSGFNPHNISELHGNRMLEICRKCSKKYFRDFITRQAKGVNDHQTCRICEDCQSILYDTIVNFGEYLPELQLQLARKNMKKSDVCLTMGSSLRVSSHILQDGANKRKLIIVNLQKTPLDKLAYIRVHAMCDEFMKRLIQKLQIQVPPFLLTRLIQFKRNKDGYLLFRGIQQRGIPYQFLKSVTVAFNGDKLYQGVQGEPFKIYVKDKEKVSVMLQFNGWLGEPFLKVDLDNVRKAILRIEYDPKIEQWVSKQWEQPQKYMLK